jgi:hypothetical protein
MPTTVEKMRRQRLFAKELKKRASEKKDNMPYDGEKTYKYYDPWAEYGGCSTKSVKKFNAWLDDHEEALRLDETWDKIGGRPDESYKSEYEGPFTKEKTSVEEMMNSVANADYAEMEERVLALLSDTKTKANNRFKEAFLTGLDRAEKEKPAYNTDDALFLKRKQDEILVWYPRHTTQENGYADNTVDIGAMAHFNTADLLARFFMTCHYHYGAIHNWRENCIGVTSIYFDAGHPGLQMPVFDYDGKNVKTRIRKDVKLLQKEHGLGDAWVYETRRGFHVYFFCDAVARTKYPEMVNATAACKGFKRTTLNRGYAILRVSAKYTDFDIKFLYVLSAKDKKLRRLPRKAHLIQALLALGEQCGTHFASLYPQWARYTEDQKEWKPAPKRKPGKRIRKVKDYTWVGKEGSYGNKKLEELTIHEVKPAKAKYAFGHSPPASTASTTTTYSTLTFDANNGFITTTGSNSGNND